MIILLIPGFPDWSRLVPILRMNYFAGVAGHLRSLGFEVIQPEFDQAFETVRRRAEQIGVLLNEGNLKGEQRRVHLVGHSAGGVAARFLVSPEGLNQASRVRSITTIGTPHRGTPISDVANGLTGGAKRFFDMAEGICPGFHEGILELASERMEKFNKKFANGDGVEYRSYGGQPSVKRLKVTPYALVRSLLDPHGPHDGWVPLESARFGTFRSIETADHSEQIGVDLSPEAAGIDLASIEKYNHLDLYARIAGEIASLGE